MADKKLILVSGDCVCDHNFYKGDRHTADSPKTRGFRVTESCGGALLLKRLIGEVMADVPQWEVGFGGGTGLKADLPSNYHAFCLWEPQVANPGDPLDKQYEVWRAVEPPLGYGPRDGKHTIKACGTCSDQEHARATTPGIPDIVVIDDADLGFRDADARTRWPLPARPKGLQWVVLKLTGSPGQGDLWEELVRRFARRLVVVLPADLLRGADVRISRGLSWEATAEDLMAELALNPALKPLLQARHLIVTFRSDGALWLDNDGKARQPATLVFDAAMAEGEWSEQQGKGLAFGFMCCFVAAVVRELCLPKGQDPDLESALAAGLSASRTLRRAGHGRVQIDDAAVAGKKNDNPAPGFPYSDVVNTIAIPHPEFVSAIVQREQARRGRWMMLDDWQRVSDRLRPHYEAAMAVAMRGPETLERFPVAQFGGYRTVDRREIESLRTIRTLIRNYLDDKTAKTPLNLGVFGPPGSGKSYIAYQIASAVGIREEDVLLFNLSQFKDVADICGAFHQVRDKVVKGMTPFVFWDEFDSRGYHWLQYLLAPMEDGAFQEGQITHPIGRCICVYAGATSYTFEQFGPMDPNRPTDAQKKSLKRLGREQRVALETLWRDFVLAKGPDFKSRIVAFLDLLGMNCRQEWDETKRRWVDDKTDLCFPIRRALFMRTLFGLKQGQELDMDPHLVQALLEIPRYKGAGRSLEFLCKHLKRTGRPRATRSCLPGEAILSMHVAPEAFWKLCERDVEFASTERELAALLHEAYRLRIRGVQAKKHLDVPFDQLPEDFQNANIGQARRIPGILRLVHLKLAKGPVVSLGRLRANRNARAGEAAVRKRIRRALEMLAEAEHNGWMVERMMHGWKYGRVRDDEAKRHNDLIPYSRLSEDTKNYDRWTIIGKAAKGKPSKEQFGYVDIVKTVGLRVVIDDAAVSAASGKA